MTPLGAWRTDEPAPTGLCQVKRGVNPIVVTMTNAVSVRPLHDGSGTETPMRISITPARAGMWLVRAETIWLVPDAIWTYWHWGVRCVPLDADGKGDDRHHRAQHSAQTWCEAVIDTAYRLNAGVAYYAEMYWPQSSYGYNNQYYAGVDYHSIMGEFVED